MNPRTRVTILVGAPVLLGLALATACGPLTFSERDISLRKEGMTDLTAEAAPLYLTADPGGNPKVERGFYGAPPAIPHTVVDMGVTTEANDCLDCHEQSDKDTPGLPPSHRIKARMETVGRHRAVQGQTTRVVEFYKVRVVAGNRYDCMLCHVAEAQNVTLLVENTFKPEIPGDAQKDVLDALNQRGDF